MALVVPGEAASPRPSHPPEHLRVVGGRIVDGRGRAVLLRGVNVNQLGDYFQPNPGIPSTLPFSREDLERIAALGMNSVRLIVHWSLLEPSPGMRDEGYLDRIRQAVSWADELGLMVVLDMHQDAWGKHINTASDETCLPPASAATGWGGAPEWATLTDGLPRCRYFLREVSFAVAQAFESFWVDRPASDGVGIQQHLVDTWEWLAGAFRNDPTVVGYDLLNEPHPGYTPAASDVSVLGEYYRRALSAIRRAERGGLTKIVFFEPMNTWSATSVGLPRPFTLDTQIVYAPHIYTGSLTFDQGVTGQEVIPLRQGFEQGRREAAAYGTTFWSGEWGKFSDDATNAAYTKRYAALEDEFQVGGAFWQWKQACGDPHTASWPSGSVPETSGNLVIVRCGDPAQPAGVDVGVAPLLARVLARPYPRRFPGEVVFTSDSDARSLVVEGRGGLGAGALEVWMPGEGIPVVTTSGLGDADLRPVPGGWIIEARPKAAEWRFEATGS